MELEINRRPILPERFIDLKRSIAPQDNEAKQRFTETWNDLLKELRSAIEQIKKEGSNVSALVELTTVFGKLKLTTIGG